MKPLRRKYESNYIRWEFLHQLHNKSTISLEMIQERRFGSWISSKEMRTKVTDAPIRYKESLQIKMLRQTQQWIRALSCHYRRIQLKDSIIQEIARYL